jgi:tetratricopeptide (TPR) repeat protein
MRRELLVSLLLIGTVLAAFAPVWNCGFVDYDDPDYVTQNPQVQSGLTLRGVVWAFTASHAANWHPLTWLSHMLDCSLFGLNPGPHHAVSLLLHLASTLALFAVMKRMTGTLWRSALVAVLFALHPLHVESVAWIAERKDVLSTFFWMLTLWAYAGYVERPGRRRYLLVVVAFALGLLAKPMVVTLPFVLLLLDFWPLKRFRVSQMSAKKRPKPNDSGNSNRPWLVFVHLVREKVPLFALSAAASLATLWVQRSWGAVLSADELAVSLRVENVLISYLAYIQKVLWPIHLSVFYPLPTVWPASHTMGAGLALAILSLLAIRLAGRFPYLIVGWFWYLGTLVPVIGLVQVGAQSMADRYTYIPLIGLFIFAAWSIPEPGKIGRFSRAVLGSSAAALTLILMIFTWLQVRHWKSSISLFEHALAVNGGNYLAHGSLGLALAEMGRTDEAIAHYTDALRVNPNYATGHLNLGLALAGKGNVAAAIAHYREALRLKPISLEVLNNLAWTLATAANPALRDPQEAVRLAEEACALTNYSNPTVLDTLAAAYAEGGRFEDAVRVAQKAIELAHSFNLEVLAQICQERLTLYKAGRPYHELPAK